MSGGFFSTLFGGVGLADSNPIAETVSAAPGNGALASRMDHTHPRLTSTATGTLNASGEATVASISIEYVEAADNQPVVFKVKSWAQDGNGNYTGCVIKGYRSQTLPQNLVALLVGTVVNLFAASASGVEYSLIAVQSSS